MIRFVDGDLFESDADFLVNPVNTVGVMGAGIAREFKRRWPDMFSEYRRACSSKKLLRGGDIWVWTPPEHKPAIINVATKEDWRNPSQHQWIVRGLEKVAGYLRHENGVLAMPAIGCGHGGLDWLTVKELIVGELSDITPDVVVYEPR